MDHQAVRPNYFKEFSSLEALKPIERVDEVLNDPEQEALYAMTQTKGWKIYRDFVENLMRELDQSVLKLMENGADYQTIGQSTVAKEITKDVLGRTIKYVEDAGNAVEDRRLAERDEKPR